MIELTDVAKTYRGRASDVRAVAGVSLTIAAGEFVAVTGPSGSGKSTLLHLIGGLDVPTSGRVVVDGAALAEMSDDELTRFRRCKVGFVFQAFNLLPTYSAEENVGLPLELAGVSTREVRERVERALEHVGIGHRRRHRPDELSGGELQRVAIARALVVEPVVLLADEPTGNLDSEAGTRVLDALAAANREAGCTVVLVTHDQQAAVRAQRVVRLHDGMLVG
jgi:putative ABC transport system ATP-binding protein